MSVIKVQGCQFHDAVQFRRKNDFNAFIDRQAVYDAVLVIDMCT